MPDMKKIMKKISALFTKKTEEPDTPEDILTISRKLGPLIDQAANETLASYQAELLAQDITYIVPAVWGAAQDGEMTVLQKEIHRKISPQIKQIVNSFEFKDIRPSQKFAVGYIVRGLIISKIAYMIVTLRNECLKQDKDILSRLDPVGKA